MAYVPPTGSSIDLSFDTAYSPPTGGALVFEFATTPGAILPTGTAPGGVGSASVTPAARAVAVQGIATGAVGAPAVANKQQFVLATGFVGAAGNPSLHNTRQSVAPAGAAPGAVSAPAAFNWRQYIVVDAYPPSVYGTSWVSNWRQPVFPAAWASQALGNPSLPSYTLYPSGFTQSMFGELKVSPQILYAVGANMPSVGYPTVQPAPRLTGWDSAAFGTPTAGDTSRRVQPAGCTPEGVGQPAVFTLRQVVLPPSLIESGIFGDSRVRVGQRFVLPPTVDDGFISPFATARNRNVAVYPYAIAPGSVGTAAPHNASPNLTPPGPGPESFGVADVGARVKYITATGVVFLTVSPYAEVRNVAQGLRPTGIAPYAPAVELVSHGRREVLPAGSAFAQFGGATAWPALRWVRDGGGADVALYGDASVESTLRTVSVPTVITGDVGTPGLTFRVRTVDAPGVAFTYAWQQFGGAVVRDAVSYVGAASIVPGDVGDHKAARDERAVAPEGIWTPPGTPDVQLLRRVVSVRQTPDQTEFGATALYNARQYALQSFDEVLYLRSCGVGAPEVGNRDRQIGTFGFSALRMTSGALVENAARLVCPSGLVATIVGANAAGLRVRSVAPGGFTYNAPGEWGLVLNGRRYVEPSGVPRPYAGVPTVLDTTQRVGPVGGDDTARFGLQFTAPRVRTVSLERWGVPYGFFPDGAVQLYTRRVAPSGFTLGAGVPTVEPHRDVIAPKGQPHDAFGGAKAVNRTPQVYAAQWSSEEFGRAGAKLYTRYAQLDGFSAAEWGKPITSDRRRYVYPGGIETLRIGRQTVAFDAPQVPAQQKIMPEGAESGNFPWFFGRPDLLYRGAMPEGVDSAAFGAASVRTNVVSGATIPLHEVDQMGVPSLNPTQFIRVSQTETPEVPRPRITPWTIWIHEPPLPWQPEPFSLVDEIYSSTYPTFGAIVVTHSRRAIEVAHSGESTAVGNLTGDPTVAAKHRRLSLPGIQPGRFGFPKLPTGGLVSPYWGRYTEEWVEGGDFDTAVFGTPTVAVPEPVSLDRHIAARGELAGSFGSAAADLWIRTIPVEGIYSTSFTGETSVHPPVVLYPSGFTQAAFVAPWVSLKVRHIVVEGDDMSEFDYAVGSGSFYPLRVRRRNVVAPGGALTPQTPAPVVTLPDLGAVVSIGDTARFGRPRLGACSC